MDDLIALAHVPLDWLGFQAASLPNMVFFQEIDDFLDDEIREYASNLLGRVAAIVGGVVLSLLTLWILIQGYRIATGQSRESMMALVTHSLRAVLIIGIATGAAAGNGSLYGTLTDGLTDTVNAVMTGTADGGTDRDIDKALAIMQTAFEVIDSVDSGGDVITDNDKAQALWLAGIGLGGPAIMAATALLLNKIAMALIVGLGPVFILCLLFEPTKPLFDKWLYYGIGTLFSMALLSVMVTLAMDMVIAVGLAFWASDWLGGGQEGLTALAMQQGGLGLILSMLIISVPSIVAMFFRGVMGNFSPYSAFGSGQRAHSASPFYPEAAPAHIANAPTDAARELNKSSQPLDEIKQGSLGERNSFLERYPNALASREAVGGGDELPLFMRLATTDSPVASRPYVDGDGYMQDAGVTKHAVPALEKGPIDGPLAIVLHRTVSTTASSTLTAFERGIGTHFIIDKDGTIYQAASLTEKTAHVGPIRSRCYAEGTCSPDEAKRLESYGPRQGHNHEKSKDYPERYPMNEDSVGIEVVGMYFQATGQWDVPTKEQKESVSYLVRLLQSNFSMTDADVYEHDKISRKTAGEGAGLYDGDDGMSVRFPSTFR